MSPKNKSFFEDTLILIIVGVAIYGIYHFFFAKNEPTTFVKQEPIIEKKVEITKKNEPTIADIQKAKAIVENKNLKDSNENTITTNANSQPNTQINTQINQESENETLTVQTKDIEQKFTDIKSFYKDIENRIYKNIKKNVTEPNNSNKSASIRVTILKDGKYEQLTFMGGDRKYFNKIKSSIKEIFPLKIDEEIKYKFPRYFRMKVK